MPAFNVPLTHIKLAYITVIFITSGIINVPCIINISIFAGCTSNNTFHYALIVTFYPSIGNLPLGHILTFDHNLILLYCYTLQPLLSRYDGVGQSYRQQIGCIDIDGLLVVLINLSDIQIPNKCLLLS